MIVQTLYNSSYFSILCVRRLKLESFPMNKCNCSKKRMTILSRFSSEKELDQRGLSYSKKTREPKHSLHLKPS